MYYFHIHIIERLFSTYHPTVCYVCLKRAIDCDLKRCSGCKLALYCSKLHQKIHWAEHKDFCKAAQTIAKRANNATIFDTQFTSYNDWCYYKNILQKCLATELNRPLRSMEQQMINIPYCCNHCYQSKPKMITCEKCCAIAWCSVEHLEENQNAHAAACEKLKSCLACDIGDQEGYYLECRIKECPINFPERMERFLNSYVNVKTQPPEAYNYGVLNVSNLISFVLSSYYALKKAKPTLLTDGTEITIHVLGPGDVEKVGFVFWEYLFHICKKLKTINLFYIGPELSNEGVEANLCQDCVKRNREIIFKSSKCLYHDYVTPELKKPDLIIAFNCGFHEFHPTEELFTWEETIPLLFETPDVIVAFTAYTKTEAILDFNFVKTHSTRTDLNPIVQHEPNPYRSVKPVRDWNNLDEENCIFYFNSYITILVS